MYAHNCDVIDWSVTSKEELGTLDVVTLSAHVQRTESALALRVHLSPSLQQHVGDVVVAAARRAMERRQLVLKSKIKI